MAESHDVTGVTVDKSPTEEKSEGQQMLERMLGVERRLATVRDQLAEVTQAIGLSGQLTTNAQLPPRLQSETAPVTKFLPGLRLIADAIDKRISDIEGATRELVKGF